MKALLMALLLLVGCATARSSSDRVISTLYVTNQTGEFVGISIVETGQRIGTALTRGECIRIFQSDLQGRDLVSLRFEINRSDSFTTPMVNLASYSWAINIGPYPQGRHIDAQSIKPVERCDLD